MKFIEYAGRLSIVVVLFIVGFTGRAVYQNEVAKSASAQELVSVSAVPAVRGVLYDGGFPNYAAVSDVNKIETRSSPDESAPVTHTFEKTNAEGAPQTFLITGQQLKDGQPLWYQVLLPVRPNQSKGWVRATEVHVEGMAWRLDIHRASYKVDLYKDNVYLASYSIGLGTDKTPTPDGLYSVIEILQPPNQNTLYGTHVLGLNGYSDVETDWPDGGHIALHGTNAPKTTIGKKVSHGCVRLNNADIDVLAGEIPLGTPVRISND